MPSWRRSPKLSQSLVRRNAGTISQTKAIATYYESALGEFLKGYEASAWIGVGVPKGTPADIIATLNREINAAIVDPTIKHRLDELGAMVVSPASPTEFASFIAEDAAKWAKVIKSAGIKPQ